MTTLENIKNQANEALALAGKATPGPWITNGSHIYEADKSLLGQIDKGNEIFVAAARTLVPQQAENILKLVAALNKAIEQRDMLLSGDGYCNWTSDDYNKYIDAILSGGK